MEHRWPFSAGMPATGVASFSEEVCQDEVHKKTAESSPSQPGDVDPRVLFATRFWGRRRFSDSASHMPHPLIVQGLPQLNLHSNNGHSNDPPHILTGPFPLERERPATPTSARSFHSPPRQHHIYIHHVHHHYYHRHPASIISSPSSSHFPSTTPPTPVERQESGRNLNREQKQTGFLHIPGYIPHTIYPRNQVRIPSRREEFADALGQIEVKTGAVTVKGAGHLARPFLVDNRAGLNWFLERSARTLLVPPAHCGITSNSYGGLKEDGRGGTAGFRDKGKHGKHLGQRELRMLESELFDVGRFLTAGEGGVGGRYLTVLTWSEDNAYGNVTLFEVEVEAPPPLMRTTTVGVAGGLAARRRFVPAPLDISPSRQKVVGVRPVAAMEDVPRQVLVGMRLDQGVKKAVLQLERGSGRFRWTAQHTKRGPPSYTRVSAVEDLCEVQTATGTGFDDNYQDGGRRRYRKRDARLRGRSSLRVDDARDTVAHQSIEIEFMAQVVDGVVATIPQFLALLHAGRSVIEKASSMPATAPTVETENGERLRAVVLDGVPKGMRDRGRDVHVVVLVPDGAKWADERIFWTDDQGGLAELRQKKYRNVIDSGRVRPRREHASRSDDWHWATSSPGPLSSPRCLRTARW